MHTIQTDCSQPNQHTHHNIPSIQKKHLKNSLRTNHIPRPNLPLNPSRTSRPNRHRQRLKRTLRPMMIIITIRTPHMQRHSRGLRKTLQSMRNHLRTQIPNLLPPEPNVNHRPRPTRQINHRPRQRLIQRRIAPSESRKRLSCPECFGESAA